MKLFIHGDQNQMPGSISYYDTVANFYSAQVYFRFGIDTNNYYEYRQPIRYNPDPNSFGWDEISIEFSELTAIKQERDSSNTISRPVEGKSNHFYRVKGNPSLTQLKFLMVGIINPDNPDKPYSRGGVSGEVWINELRVIGADDSPGWAYSVSSQLKLADLLTVNFNMNQTNPYFHRLSDRFGSRVESKNWNTAADLDVLKLIPFSLTGSNLKLNYSHTESVGKPLYLPGTDIRVDQAANRLRQDSSRTTNSSGKTADQVITESQTVNISDSWSSSNIKLKIPWNYWLIRDTWNALAFGFNYNRAFGRNPTIMSTKSWVWNAQMNYNLTFSPDYFFYLTDIPVLRSIVSLFSDYRDVRVYFTPQSFQFNVSANRNRAKSNSRPQPNITSLESVSRDFTSRRGFNFAWKITEGGFLNLSTTYNVNINASLAYLETEKINGVDVQRSEKDIWRDILSGAYFGKDYNYQQNIDFRSSPKLPSIWNLNKFFTLSAGYSVSYQWNNDLRQEDIGRSAGFSNKSSVGLMVRLKSLFQPLFLEAPEDKAPEQQQTSGNKRGRDVRQESPENRIEAPDSLTAKKDSLISGDSTAVVVQKKAPLKNAILFLTSLVKSILFDYESISINFTNDNSLSKSGILGKGTGFYNFWGVEYKEDNGPSRGFMFGLSGDVGRRTPGYNLQDVFSQKNKLDFKTSRPLWTGAKIDINWSVGWSINKTTTLKADEDGTLFISNVASTGSIDRSFLSLPPFLFLSVFKTGIKQVNELYDPEAENKNENLSDAFVKGFETFPWLSKVPFLVNYAKYIPRPNWNISWDGLESFFLFKAFAKKVSLNHSYTSNYTEGWKINPDGRK
ncbi:MAG: cell surface protein SprA, partial [Ignavibacteria bacterium]